VEPTRHFKFSFEERFHLEQLVKIAGALHQGEMLFYIAQYIRQTRGIYNAEVKVERKVGLL
jgi:hypothetical protein